MVSACGILLTGMLGHYANINGRLRVLSAERLDLAVVAPSVERLAFAEERLTQIDHQIPLLISRHRLVQHAIMAATSAVAILVVSMFVIAVAALTDSSSVGTVALFVFLAGTAALMASVGFMATEVRNSHAAVAYESMRVVDIGVAWSGRAVVDTTPDGRPPPLAS